MAYQAEGSSAFNGVDMAFSLRSTSRHDARSIAWFEIAAGTAICVDNTKLQYIIASEV